MAMQDYFQSMVERLQQSASVRSVYGDPISVDGKTIIPVAKIGYGFGGGSGKQGKEKAEEGEPKAECAGGGGGVGAAPVGVFEVTAEGTRFVPIVENRRLAGAMIVGFLLGWWAGKRRQRH